MIRNLFLVLTLSFVFGQSLHTHDFELNNLLGNEQISVVDNDGHSQGLCPGCLTSNYKATGKFKVLISLEQLNCSKCSCSTKDFLFSSFHSYHNIPTRAPPKV